MIYINLFAIYNLHQYVCESTFFALWNVCVAAPFLRAICMIIRLSTIDEDNAGNISENSVCARIMITMPVFADPVAWLWMQWLNFSPRGCDVRNLDRVGWLPFSLSEPTPLPWPLIVDRALLLVNKEPPSCSPNKLYPAKQLHSLHLHQKVPFLIFPTARERQRAQKSQRVGELWPKPTKHVPSALF